MTPIPNTKKIKRVYNHDHTVFKTKNYRIIVGLSVAEARPHMILLFNDRSRKAGNIFELSQSMFDDLLTTLKKSFKRFENCIFSVHLGMYQSLESPHFHAHYILSIDDYLDTIIKYEDDLSNKFLDKLEEWPKRLKKEGNKYLKHDIKEINRLTNEKIKKFKKKGFPKLSKNYSIRFHSQQPRVAFISNSGKPNHNSLPHLINAMMEWIDFYSLNDRNIGGCHLCIQNNLWIDDEFSGVVGYVQVDPVNYYLINPDKDKWLKIFEQETYFVLT